MNNGIKKKMTNEYLILESQELELRQLPEMKQ